MKNNLTLTKDQLNLALSPVLIRERAQQIFALTVENKSSFRYHPEKLKPTVDYVLGVIKKKYPDLKIPFHSRWGHFRCGGVDRIKMVNQLLNPVDAIEKARAKLDLVITSVLLDAGAGPEWSYKESGSSQALNRSEGLGVASLHMFCSGVMSTDRKSMRADAKGLQNISAADLRMHFQVNERNPLVGVEGRVKLLNNLGLAVQNKKIFPGCRPGNILDFLHKTYGMTIPAPAILRAVLDGFGSIWPGRLSAGETNLGDVWMHSKLGAPGSFASLVPFHKLSQWMTYSLIEPIHEAGYKVWAAEDMTGLAEYRNGGLMIDSGLLSLRNPGDLAQAWAPESDLIIEWRALTIYLLDQIGAEVQKSLGKTPQEFPLAKVLEGGTWWAGRYLAQEKRAGGAPPLNIISDGTVF